MDILKAKKMFEVIASVCGALGGGLFIIFIAPVGAPRWMIIPSVILVVIGISIALALQAIDKEQK
jgi:hypothetical protein